MKNELFDELLKRKIESHKIEASDLDVDRVHQHVQQNIRSKSFALGNLFKTTLVVAVIGGMGLWNYQQYQINKELMVAVNDIKSQLNSTQKSLKESQNTSQNVIEPNSIETQNQIKQLKNEFETTTYAHYYEEVKSDRIRNQYRKAIAINKPRLVANKDISPAKFTDDVSNSIPVIVEHSDDETITEVAKINQVDSSKLQGNDLSILKLDTSQSEKTAKKKTRFFDFLKGYKYRVGVGTDFGRGLMGMGVTSEVLFNPKWSLSFGLDKTKIFSDHFRDDDEYMEHHSRDFRSEYASHYNNSTRISNIDFQFSVIQMPVNIGYRFYQFKKLTLFGNLGTTLDLKVNQMVNYQSTVVSELPQQNSLELLRPVNLINAANIGLGAEMPIYKRIWLQTTPYLLVNFKPNEYRREPISPGIKLRLYYQF